MRLRRSVLCYTKEGCAYQSGIARNQWSFTALLDFPKPFQIMREVVPCRWCYSWLALRYGRNGDLTLDDGNAGVRLCEKLFTGSAKPSRFPRKR